jgi:hypothetical protein
MLLAQTRPSKPVLQQLEEQALGITSKELKLKAEEKRKERHRQRREQHENETEEQRQEHLRQHQQQQLQWREQQQQWQVQQLLQQQERQKQRRPRSQQQQQLQEQEHQQQLQLLLLMHQQSNQSWQPDIMEPFFSSRTPTPERRQGRSAAADSDTDSVTAAKQQAAAIDTAVSAGDQQAYQQLLSCFHTVSADGLSAWQADVEWWDDPVSAVGEETLKNVVLTTVRVEMIRASIV